MFWISKEDWDKQQEFIKDRQTKFKNWRMVDALNMHPFNLSDEDFEKYINELKNDNRERN